jgi:hypothetical protein
MKTITAISEATFNPLKTLTVIEADKHLLQMFNEEVKVDINTLRTSLQHGLKSEANDFLQQVFEKVILTKKQLLNKYNSLPETTPTKTKKERKFPRRYGKVQILADIKKAGGKGTDIQRAMLSLNDFRNTYVNLTNKLIKDYFSDKKALTNADYRDITALVDSMEKKLAPIFKKK